MHKLLASIVLALCLLPAYCATVITDTIKVPITGQMFHGHILISAPTLYLPDGSIATRIDQYSIPVAAGVQVSVTLEPNDSALNHNTYYTVQYVPIGGPSYTRYWIVPTSMTPLTISAVEGTVTLPPMSWFLTHKGDLLGFDGTQLGRLPVNPDGQILVTDSTQTFGWGWKPVASVVGNNVAQWNASQLQGRAIAASPAPSDLQYLGWNDSLSQWEPKTFPGLAPLYYQAIVGATQRSNLAFSGNFTLSDSGPSDRTTVDLALTITSNTIGNAATATAFAVIPTPCNTGFYARGVDKNGNSLGCTAASGGAGTVFSVTFPTAPSWLTASVANGTNNPAISLVAASGQTSHRVIGTCGSATSFGPCALVAADIPALDASNVPTGVFNISQIPLGLNQSTTGNAATATALGAVPTKCNAGNYPLGIDATGNAQNCTAATSGVVSVFGRPGAVAATNGDYNASQVTNAFDITVSNTLTNVAAPSTPASGKLAVWADSTNKVLQSKDNTGAIGTMVKPVTLSTSNWVQYIDSTGTQIRTQPSVSDIIGGNVNSSFGTWMFGNGTQLTHTGTGIIDANRLNGVTLTGTSGHMVVWGTLSTLVDTGIVSSDIPSLANGNAWLGTQDARSAAHTFPVIVKTTAALLATSCTIGEEGFASDAVAGLNNYGCTSTNTWTLEGDGSSGGGGASIPVNVTFTSGTVLTIGTGQTRVGSSVFAFTSPATATLTSVTGTQTAYFYVDGSGIETVGIPSSGMAVTCSGCTVVSGITGYPAFSIPLYHWSAASGVWAGSGTDDRSILSIGPVITGGTGISVVATPAGVQINNTGTLTVASGSQALATSSISSGSCATAITISAGGVLATDNILADFNADPHALTGYGVSVSGGLTIYKWTGAGSANLQVCNSSSGAIVPGAATLNWRVVR